MNLKQIRDLSIDNNKKIIYLFQFYGYIAKTKMNSRRSRHHMDKVSIE
jgi:hypothetical protein